MIDNKKDIAKNMRNQMRSWVSGVGIAASLYEGAIHGMTISSFTSISIEPPRIIISLDKDTRTHAIIKKSGLFAVTLLTEQQKDISMRFAGALEDKASRFDGIDFSSSASGNPIIAGGLAYFDCQVMDSFEAGNQTVFIGDVIEAGLPKGAIAGATPLVYFDRDYRALAE